MRQAHTYLTSEYASIDELLAPVPGWLDRPLTPADGLPAAQARSGTSSGHQAYSRQYSSLTAKI